MYQKLSIKLSEKDCFLIFVCLIWGYKGFFRYVSIVINRIPIIGSAIGPYVVTGIIAIATVSSVPYIVKRIRYKDLSIYIFIFFAAILTYLFNKEACAYLEPIAVSLFFKVVPLYFVGRAYYFAIEEDKSKLDLLYVISILAIWANLVVSSFQSTGFDKEWYSSMSVSYTLLPHLLLILAYTFKTVNIINLGTLLVGTGHLLMMGNRGSVVCLLAMTLILVLSKLKNVSIKRKFTLIVIIASLIYIVLFTSVYDIIIRRLYLYASANHLSTRVFQTLMGEYSSTVSFDSGRLSIQKTLFELLLQNPLGYGLCSDRASTGGWYAHNLYLEILFDYGVFMGGLLVVAITYMVVKAIRITNNNPVLNDVLYVLLSCGFVKLFISASYLQEPYFFFLIGYLVSIFQFKRKEIRRS